MKKSLTIILLCLFNTIGDAQNLVTNSYGEQQLYGVVNATDLLQAPFKEWFEENQKDYNSTLTKVEGALLKNVKIKAFFGTWCGDTQYLLPRFMEACESMNLDENQIELIALHVDSTLYKQGPNQETIGYNIHKVPTFIFEKDGSEIGRIVERTIFDLDTDISLIAKQLPYKNRYQAVSLISKFIEEQPLDSLYSESVFNDAKQLIRRELSGPSELGIYAFTLKLQGALEEAKFVFKLNKEFHKYDPWSISIYGRLLLDIGDFKGAQEQYYEALRIKKKDPLLIKRLLEIDEKLALNTSD